MPEAICWPTWLWAVSIYSHVKSRRGAVGDELPSGEENHVVRCYAGVGFDVAM